MKQALWRASGAGGHHSTVPSSFLRESQSHGGKTEGLELLPPTAQGEGQAVPTAQPLTLVGTPLPTAQTPPPSLSPLRHSFWVPLFCYHQCPCSVGRSACTWRYVVLQPWSLVVSGTSSPSLQCHGQLQRAEDTGGAHSTHPILQFLGQRYQRQSPTHAAGTHMDAKSGNDCHQAGDN